MDKYIYRSGVSDIFEFSFMDDFTTVAIIKEEGEIDISKLKYENDDDFYCFSEEISYTEEELFKKFNIEAVEHTEAEK